MGDKTKSRVSGFLALTRKCCSLSLAFSVHNGKKICRPNHHSFEIRKHQSMRLYRNAYVGKRTPPKQCEVPLQSARSAFQDSPHTGICLKHFARLR